MFTFYTQTFFFDGRDVIDAHTCGVCFSRRQDNTPGGKLLLKLGDKSLQIEVIDLSNDLSKDEEFEFFQSLLEHSFQTFPFVEDVTLTPVPEQLKGLMEGPCPDESQSMTVLRSHYEAWRSELPLKQITAGILINEKGEILLGQRAAHSQWYANLWEFPGGQIEAGESPEEALSRELQEELSITVSLEELYSFGTHTYACPTCLIVLHLYTLDSWEGQIKGNVHKDLQWVCESLLDTYPVPPADLPVIKTIQQRLKANTSLAS